MKIISKRQAMALYRQHPGSRLFRFSTGKYQWSGSICHYVGREVEDIREVLTVFVERLQDRNGPYACTLFTHFMRSALSPRQDCTNRYTEMLPPCDIWVYSFEHQEIDLL
ncbi:DUF987 family protein [Salmonella enterica subsp. enterica serovar Saintpaul]|nr:DUF987 family protein [Salmonella enterica subsp. enterica serovar Saintpaul]